MERPRALVRRASALSFVFVAATFALAGCEAELEKLPQRRSSRESLGQEIYKALCRRVAAIEMPTDLDGRDSYTLCLGDAESAALELDERRAKLPPRLVALADRREVIASSLDELLPGELGGGLERLMRELLPFYDPPEERLQQGTRALAAMLTRLAADDVALEGLARFGREGMVPTEGTFGLLRAASGVAEIGDALRGVLPPLTEDPAVTPGFDALLAGFALELGTTEIEGEPGSDVCRMRALLARPESEDAAEGPRFASGAPLYSVVRDVRGMPVPRRASGEAGSDQLSACGDGSAAAIPVPFPFVDGDGDGFADIEGPTFAVDPQFSGVLPEPYPVAGETGLERDDHGRAFALAADGSVDKSAQLYVTQDVDGTLLAALLREGARLFQGEPSAFTSLAGALPALLGDSRPSTRTYAQHTHLYMGTDPSRSPLVELVHASGVLLADPVYDESLELSLRLLREREGELVQSLAPMLAIERRTRPGSDAYPDAVLPRNTFWDELLFELEKLSRFRKTAGGESMLEAAVRAMLGTGRNFNKPDAPVEQLLDPTVLSHQGALLATMLRFKDEWRANPVGESKRQPGEPGVLGAFRTPVDRDKPDTPITCGRDGCAGLVEGSPFEAFALPGQNCVIQRKGRPVSSKDCGEPANQSLFQRSMGMIAEMEGRSQCNRPIAVGDLFDFAATEEGEQDPVERARTIRDAEEALARDYTCPADDAALCRAYADRFPAAFVDADGAGPAKPTIQECALLDLDDVGRTFGKVLTHEYVLEIPNPWVRRYLEDVARAADDTLVVCEPGTITDPTVVPDCIPEAARLSRNVFEELGPCLPSSEECVDTLGELVEFLLDDKALFPTARDAEELRPDARALSRVMFTPAGSSNFVLFAPLLLRGSPVACAEAPGVEACVDSAAEPTGACCIRDLLDPPLRYRLDTFYGSTTFAWEQPLELADGSTLSFLDAMAPIADAFNRLDIGPGDDPADFEDTRYGLTVLGSVVASHYDSDANPAAQSNDPAAPGYRKLTGLVRYEELLADLLDDGSLVATQQGPGGQPLFAEGARYTPEQQLGLLQGGMAFLQALDAFVFRAADDTRPEEDGIAATVRIAESWLNPHAYCAGPDGDSRVLRGVGACHGGGARAPLTTYDGRDYECWNDGCFDGEAGREKRFVSPLDLVLEALSDVKSRTEDDPAMRASARGILSGLLDAYAPIEDGRLKQRRLRAVVLTLGDYMRERWAEERADNTLADFGKRTTDDVVDVLTNPLSAGAFSTLYWLSKHPAALGQMSRTLGSMLDEDNAASSRAMLAYAADAREALPGDASTKALGLAFASAVAPNVADVLAGREATLDTDGSLVSSNLFMLRETALADKDGVLEQLLGNLARMPGQAPNLDRDVPMTALFDALIDFNRADPSATGLHDAADYRAAFTRIAEVLMDERRGFERLYRIVQCANTDSGPPSCD